MTRRQAELVWRGRAVAAVAGAARSLAGARRAGGAACVEHAGVAGHVNRTRMAAQRACDLRPTITRPEAAVTATSSVCREPGRERDTTRCGVTRRLRCAGDDGRARVAAPHAPVELPHGQPSFEQAALHAPPLLQPQVSAHLHDACTASGRTERGARRHAAPRKRAAGAQAAGARAHSQPLLQQLPLQPQPILSRAGGARAGSRAEDGWSRTRKRERGARVATLSSTITRGGARDHAKAARLARPTDARQCRPTRPESGRR